MKESLVGKKLSIASAAVPWALSLLGVPDPAVTGGLSTAAALVSAFPKRRKDLAVFVGRAMEDFDNQCASEARGLGEADTEAVQHRLKELLSAPSDRDGLMAAALLGERQFQEHLVGDRHAYEGLGDDGQGYLNALLTRVHGLVLRFAQSEEVFGVAGTAAFRVLQQRIAVLESQVATRPTSDQVMCLVRDWRERSLIVGARPALVAGFVDRDELTALRDSLSAGGIATVCALHGMRGVGKSQLASAFAQECENAGWPFVGWVTASSREQAIAELAAMARSAALSDDDDPRRAADALLVWLNGGPSDRLLVMDNVSKIDDVSDLLPRGPGMRVIVTTTSRTGTLGTPVEVGVFTSVQAVDYLINATKQTDCHGAAGVSEDLGRLPVALTQAATAINLLNLTYLDYRELLAQRDLDDVVRQDSADPYPQKVGTALRIAYLTHLDRLDADNPDCGQSAAWVLGALSFLAESGAPRSWLTSLVDERMVAAEAIGELLRSSLVTASEDGEMVSIHRLQAQVVREDIAVAENTSGMIQAALATLTAADYENLDYWTARHQCELLTRQLVSIKDQTHSCALAELPELLQLVLLTMYHANGLGNPYLALELAGYNEIFTRVLGPDDRKSVVFRNNLARAHDLAGQLDLAIPLYEQTLRDRERILGPDDPQTATSRNNLGGAYLRAGDTGRAIPLLERALSDLELVLGADDALVIQSRSNLASAYASAGERDRAISLSRLNVAESERIFGQGDLDTARAYRGLAEAYTRADDTAQATPLLEQALPVHEGALGPDHPETLAVRGNLAVCYSASGRLDLAIALSEQTLADGERALGPDHPNVLTWLNNLARTHANAGNHARAAALYRRLLEDSEKALGADHSTTLTARSSLAAIYLAAGNPQRAIRLLERGLADSERLLGPDNPETVLARRGLAAAYENVGDFQRAIPLLEASVADSERVLGADDPASEMARDALMVARTLQAGIEELGYNPWQHQDKPNPTGYFAKPPLLTLDHQPCGFCNDRLGVRGWCYSP